jgi:hypothetical protein
VSVIARASEPRGNDEEDGDDDDDDDEEEEEEEAEEVEVVDEVTDDEDDEAVVTESTGVVVVWIAAGVRIMEPKSGGNSNCRSGTEVGAGEDDNEGSGGVERGDEDDVDGFAQHCRG